MSLKNVVPFPHCSGQCRKCHSLEYQGRGVLCPNCEKFTNQDWVRQKDGLMNQKALTVITDKARVLDFLYPKEAHENESCTTEEFERYLKTTQLSPQQRQIAFLLTIEGRTNEEIAKILKIAPGSVHSQRNRIIKKLRFCNPPAIYRRGKSESLLPEVPIVEPESVDGEDPVQGVDAVPNRFLCRICPRCRDRLFLADNDFQYCMNCSWSSDENA